jgi:hypothetical protein
LQEKINKLKIYFSLNLVKKFLFLKQQNIILYKRYHSIFKNSTGVTKILIHRGIFPVIYTNKVYKSTYKFGMFAFTRKPFAKPQKKTSKKKR